MSVFGLLWILFFGGLALVAWYVQRGIWLVEDGKVAVYAIRGKRQDHVLRPGWYVLPLGYEVRTINAKPQIAENGIVYVPDDSSAESLWKFADAPEELIQRKLERGEEWGFKIIDRLDDGRLTEKATLLKRLDEQYEKAKGDPAIQQLYEEERRRILEED